VNHSRKQLHAEEFQTWTKPPAVQGVMWEITSDWPALGVKVTLATPDRIESAVRDMAMHLAKHGGRILSVQPVVKPGSPVHVQAQT
jgi:hypothetical protein